MVFVGLLKRLLQHKELGKWVVPIIPDEARTFGMDALFKPYGIYSNVGQLYEPVDAKTLLAYREAKNGQILEEGITEAGAMSSFIAAGTAYATHGIPTIPFFIYYSMFGFQRIGDLIWAAADMRTRGFLLGGTAGRTTLNGEGLQHQDGHSHLLASTVPNLQAYDPAFAYELAVIIQDGIRRMYEDGERHLLLHHARQREVSDGGRCPKAPTKASCAGMYKLRPAADKRRPSSRRSTCSAAGRSFARRCGPRRCLAERFGVAADVWSVTSYKELRREALEASAGTCCTRRPSRGRVTSNELLPRRERRLPRGQRLHEVGAGDDRALGAGRPVPAGHRRLRPQRESAALRRFFEVDAECIVVAALSQLARRGEIKAGRSSRRRSRSWGLTQRKSARRNHDCRLRGFAFARAARTRSRLRQTGEMRMATEIKLPELGENLAGGEVSDIKVAAGDDVTEGQTLLEIEAEKSTVEVPSPLAGKIKRCW